MNFFGAIFGESVDYVTSNTCNISGINTYHLVQFIKKTYGSEQFFYTMCNNVRRNSFTINNFFIPEIVYILDKAADERFISPIKANSIIKLIYNKTWFGDTLNTDIDNVTDLKNIEKEIIPSYKLTPTQLEFIKDIYYTKKTQYQLNGYLLSLDPGLGKTFTSLALYTALHKKHAIVICPLSIITNVWINEINKVFVKRKNIWSITNNSLSEINNDTDFIIVNYENISKITPYVSKIFTNKDTIIIVDECHNFKDYKSNRTVQLIDLVKSINCTDTLLMSGTPIKALGQECIPIFKILDKFYSPVTEQKLLKLNRYRSIMNELLRNRLGMMMYRKLKKDVLDLPEKHEIVYKIKLPHGDDYTLDNIKILISRYTTERTEYYKKHSKMYEETFYSCLKYFEQNYINTQSERIEYNKYLKCLNAIIKNGYMFDTIEDAKFCNMYEKTVIIPKLTGEMKHKFRDAKAVVKYVQLKILGEVLGNLLNKLRIDMTSSLINSEVIDIIKNAEKKTILFSSYIDALNIAEQKCKKAGLNPVVINGANSKDAASILQVFKADNKLNPLIASIKAMSTGHTILEANTVIFLNVPFRSVDYEQASDRVYRIGQTSEVYIYKLELDTGEKPNLSNRMHEIINWSKEQFDAIVGDGTDIDENIDVSKLKTFMDNPDFGFSKFITGDFVNLINSMVNRLFK